MVKINTICRVESEYGRETKNDIYKVHLNPNPQLHPMSKPREYQRALVASKIQKIFSKPFLGCLSGHSDGISVLCKSPMNLSHLVSGSFDGELRFWDMSLRKCLFNVNAHNLVKGLTFSNSGQGFLSSGLDKLINYYDLGHSLNIESYNKDNDDGDDDDGKIENSNNSNMNRSGKEKSKNSWVSKTMLNNVSHSVERDQFCSSGQIIQIWNYNRSKPVGKLEWGTDQILQAKYSPSESHILGSVGSDRSVVLYDLRTNQPLHKTILMNKSQCLSWNPQQPLHFSLGNDDANVYTFDMRTLTQPLLIHKDHISSITDIDYSPTGKDFVTVSYDKTIRIFTSNQGKSRECYHSQRMQKLHAVQFSNDNQFIYTGSDDMNIRIWKATAWTILGTVTQREQNVFDYREKLKEKFQHVSEIRKISKHRHMPKYILNQKKKSIIQRSSKIRKIQNQEINNANIFKKPKPEKQLKVIESIQ